VCCLSGFIGKRSGAFTTAAAATAWTSSRTAATTTRTHPLRVKVPIHSTWCGSVLWTSEANSASRSPCSDATDRGTSIRSHGELLQWAADGPLWGLSSAGCGIPGEGDGQNDHRDGAKASSAYDTSERTARARPEGSGGWEGTTTSCGRDCKAGKILLRDLYHQSSTALLLEDTSHVHIWRLPGQVKVKVTGAKWSKIPIPAV